MRARRPLTCVTQNSQTHIYFIRKGIKQYACKCSYQIPVESNKRHKSVNVVSTPFVASGEPAVMTTAIRTTTLSLSRDSNVYDKFFEEYLELRKM